jgi:hypothetical protein
VCVRPAVCYAGLLSTHEPPQKVTRFGWRAVRGSAPEQGSGGIFKLADETWKVDVDLPRDAVTGRRRRVSRRVKGSQEEAELVLARLKVAGHQKRLPTGGTNARSVGAALNLYREAATSGSLEPSPNTTRSAISQD